MRESAYPRVSSPSTPNLCLAALAAGSAGLGLGPIRSAVDAPLSPVARLRRLAALEKGDVVVVVVYAIAIGLVSLAVPIATQSLVNTVAFTALVQPLVVLGVLVLVGLSAAGLLRALQYRVVETLQQRFFVRATHDSVGRLARADVRAFADRGAPELMNRFFEVALVQKAASTLLMDGLSVALQAAVSLVLLAFYHPALLAFDVVLIVFIAFTLVVLGRGGVDTAIKESKAKYGTAAWLEEIAGSIRTFKATGADEFAFTRADALARAYVAARGKHFKILFRQVVASYVLQAVATAGLLGLGGFLVIKGELTLGQLVAAELIVTGVLAGVSKLGKYLESYYDLVASVDKVGAIVDLEDERQGGATWKPAEGPAHLRLDGVSFSYDGKTDAVSDVSLEVEPGARLAILGSDAGGMSTLADLVYGLRTPARGQVELDGIDLRTVPLGDLRSNVAFVGRAEVFDASVLDNLCMGREHVDAAMVAEVLDAVALAKEVGELPEGTSTRLGHSGSRLTSSQASRLAIARALLAEPRLLVIDEALDGLGAETAYEVLRGMASRGRSTTMIVFTSREEVATAVGTVVRLERGRLRRSVEVAT